MFINLFHVGTFFGKYTCFDLMSIGMDKKKITMSNQQSAIVYKKIHLFSFIETS